MTRSFSLYLDVARALASVAVVVSHLAYPSVSGGALGWARDLNIGSDAVIVFFVLSGLLISHTTRSKRRDLRAYSVARLARLWSVALPAIAFSAALCVIGWQLAPGHYAAYDAGSVATASLRGVVFSNYLWLSGSHLPGNNPFWSVTYEFWYYAAFGAFVYLRDRARLWSVTLILLIAGPRLLLLAPCWLLGVATRDLLDRPAVRDMGPWTAWMMVVLPVGLYSVCQSWALPATLTDLTSAWIGGRDPNAVFGFSDEFLWNWLIAAMTSVHFLGIAGLARPTAGDLGAVDAAVRWFAGGTFTLYLFHMPLIELAISLPSYSPGSTTHVVLLALLVAFTSFAMAGLSERRLAWWRSRVDRLIPGDHAPG